jgi:hypothetical protein
MPRRQKSFTIIETESRDYNKRFLLTEAPSTIVLDWVGRAMMLLARAGVELPEEAVAGGLEGVAYAVARAPDPVKSLGNVEWHALKPLIFEMIERCVKRQPDERHPEVQMKLILDDDIEDVRTYFTLLRELMTLHLGFSQPGGDSMSDTYPTLAG